MASKPRPVEWLPTELLLHIFAFTAGNFDPKQEPSIEVGNCSPWSKDLRVKKAVVQVCKKWRGIALPGLYHRVYLHRVGQLCALVKVLEESMAGGKQGDEGHGGWVQHIHGNLYVPVSWEMVYVKKIKKLLTLCSSSKTFSWRTSWDGPYGEPSSERSTTIKIICPTSFQKPIFHSTLSSLRKLSLSLDGLTLDHAFSHTAWFGNLEELTCEAIKSAPLRSLDFVSWCFVMPNIRSLTISIPWHARVGNLYATEFAPILRVLEHHGRRLISLALDILHVKQDVRKNVKDVLTLCPNLESLRCADCAWSAITVLDAPFLPLRKLEFFTYQTIDVRHVTVPETEPFEHFLIMAKRRENFPLLESIAVYDRTFSSIPMKRASTYTERPIFFRYFLSWTRRFREMGIALLNMEGKPIISADQERWNGWTEHSNGEQGEGVDEDEGEDSDPEDASYVYESDPDTEVSSDSASEVSVHTIGSVEALERFEDSLQQEFSDSGSSEAGDESADDAGIEEL